MSRYITQPERYALLRALDDAEAMWADEHHDSNGQLETLRSAREALHDLLRDNFSERQAIAAILDPANGQIVDDGYGPSVRVDDLREALGGGA